MLHLLKTWLLPNLQGFGQLWAHLVSSLRQLIQTLYTEKEDFCIQIVVSSSSSEPYSGSRFIDPDGGCTQPTAHPFHKSSLAPPPVIWSLILIPSLLVQMCMRGHLKVLFHLGITILLAYPICSPTAVDELCYENSCLLFLHTWIFLLFILTPPTSNKSIRRWIPTQHLKSIPQPSPLEQFLLWEGKGEYTLSCHSYRPFFNFKALFLNFKEQLVTCSSRNATEARKT